MKEKTKKSSSSVMTTREKMLARKKDLEKVVDDIKKMPTKKVYILATYTAMMQVRSILAKRGYIKGGQN